MKTIQEIINSKIASVELDKSVDTDYRIDQTYNKYPMLREIDISIVNARSSRLIAIMEGDEAPIAAIKKLEADLHDKRSQFLKDNNIRPDFDQPWVSCENCMDTGFIRSSDGRKAVCMSCMKSAVKEAFEEAGMKDYDTYTLKGFKLDYFKDSNRKKQFGELRDLIEGKEDCTKVSLLTSQSQTGKTYLSVISVKYAILQGKSAYYAKSDDLQYFEAEDLNALKDYDYIVIDDYSAEVTLGYKTAGAIYRLLEARVAKKKPTVVVSGTNREALVANSDERIAGILSRANVL